MIPAFRSELRKLFTTRLWWILALVAFLFVIQLVGVAPELTRRWDELGLARTVPVVLAATFWIDLDHSVQVPVMIGLIALTAVTTSWSRARALCSVRPLEASWGSVKTTCGTGMLSGTGSDSQPAAWAAILSPMTRARYLPQWVSGASPEASPTA